MKRLDPKLCHAMLRARDTRFDGQFFVGVKTTGIYCRPVCPARTPRSSSCEFYETAALAEDRGFRPCLRCRPELAPRGSWDSAHGSRKGGLDQHETQALPHAIYRHLQQRALSGRPVEVLAEEIGFSPRHLRRMMMEEFGVAPVKILQTERLLFAKRLLQETRISITEISGIAGFGSLRRMNTLFQSRYHLSPGSLRRAGLDGIGRRDEISLRLGFRPPFAWCAILNFLAARAIPGVEKVTDDSAYERTVRIQGASGWIRVTLDDRPNSLCVTVSSTLSRHLFAILSRVRLLFDLDANPAFIIEQLKRDRMLRPLLKKTPGLRVPGAWDGFETSVRAVLGQQVSVAGASTLSGRLVSKFGKNIPPELPGLDYEFPAAAELARIPVCKIAEIGIPMSRAETLRNLAAFAGEGGLAPVPGEDSNSRSKAMTELRGIGEWTAQYVGMRVFRNPDAFPAGDLGLRKATGTDSKTLHRQSQSWRPWRAYAAMYLWQSLH